MPVWDFGGFSNRLPHLAEADALDRADCVLVRRGQVAGEASLDLGPVVTRAVRLQAATVGSRAMFEEMVRAMELHRLEPVLEVAPRRFDGTAGVIGALAAGGHFGKVCMRAWEAG